MVSIINTYIEKIKRWDKAIEYFERPYTGKRTGKRLDDTIQEREKHYPKLIELLAEINKLHTEVFNVQSSQGQCED